MSRRAQILIATHLLAFAGACGLAKLVMPPAPPRLTAATQRQQTKSSIREPQMNRHDQERLMRTFGEQRIDPRTEYEKLKETLPIAADPADAVLAAVTEYGNRLENAGDIGLTRNEVAELLVMFEVRMLDWMLQDPEKAVDFVLTNPECRMRGLHNLLGERVFKDVLYERGVIASLSWMTKDEKLLGILGTAVADEMKAGGGIALLVAFQAEMKRRPFEDEYRTAAPEASDFSGNPDEDGPPFLKTAARNIPFSDKERFLDLVTRQPDDGSKQLLLEGFALSDDRAAPWLRELAQRGALPQDMVVCLIRVFADAVMELPHLPMDARVEARRNSPEYGPRSRRSIADELVMHDVATLLDRDRDWGEEFKNGTASPGEILATVKEGLPEIPAEQELTMRKALFYRLSEEDPAKALSVLDALTAEERRGIISSAMRESHADDRPDYFLKFLQQMPLSTTPGDLEDRKRGWESKTRGYLSRYGDEYVEWVKQMPPGIDRDAAADSLISSTNNPEQKQRYRDQLFKKRP